jgi:phage shock protein PspC (stress-responsive transcriptional regulator)
MNKTFNINLGSYPFAIDEDAYNYIQNYLETIRKHFSTSDGCDEILYDIEVRMAELFAEHLKGRAIISMKEVDEVIMIMGKPEDFGAEPMSEQHSYTSSRGRKSDTKINTGKRMFRDPDDKKVAGVCSGISAYFGIEDPLWVRLIFALLFFTGTGVITYIVLWALVPEATSTSDKLAMRGEPATIENIAKVVETELSELGDKINEWSKDLGSKKKNDTVNNHFQAKSLLSGGINMFGNVIGGIVPVIRQVLKPLFMVVAILILSVLGIAWAASFVGITFASPALAFAGPTSSIMSYVGIGSLLVVVGIPILSIMLLISRMAFKYRVHKNVKLTYRTIWIVALVLLMGVGMTTVKDYAMSHTTTSITDHNIENKEIVITMPEENSDYAIGINLGGFFVNNDDKWSIRDVKFKVEKSADGLVHIEKKVSSKGADNIDAQVNSTIVSNDLKVEGNTISISKFMHIPKGKKYRNQEIEYTIYVPEGKTVILDQNVKESMRSSELFSFDKIYSDIENLKWEITTNGATSDLWEDVFHHNKEVNTGEYHKIIIENEFDVNIIKADKSKVTFSGNKEAIEKIVQKNLDGTLTINVSDDMDVSDVTINIETPDVELIHFDGVHTAKIEGFIQKSLKIISQGNQSHERTNITFYGNVNEMDISLDGIQTLTMTGSGELLDLQILNGAMIKADKYIVKKAQWRGGNSYDSNLHVTDEIKGEEAVLNNITILGNPKKVKVDENI